MAGDSGPPSPGACGSADPGRRRGANAAAYSPDARCAAQWVCSGSPRVLPPVDMRTAAENGGILARAALPEHIANEVERIRQVPEVIGDDKVS